MDAACFAVTSSKIISVSGGRIYRCSATTGAVEASAVFNPYGMPPASVCYDSVNNVIVAATCNDPRHYPHPNPSDFDTARSIYVIDPSTLTTLSVIDMASVFSWAAPSTEISNLGVINVGVLSLQFFNGLTYVALQWGPVGAGVLTIDIVELNVTSPASHKHANLGHGTFVHDLPLWLDPLLTCADTNPNDGYVNIWGVNNVHTPFDQNWGLTQYWYNPYYVECFNAPTHLPISIVRTAAGAIFTCDALNVVRKYDSALTLQATINTGQALPFQCYHMRYNSTNGLIYLPGFGTTSAGNPGVITIDPITNAVASAPAASGVFDMPLDVVFTPIKKFAVQQASTGLKEIA